MARARTTQYVDVEKQVTDAGVVQKAVMYQRGPIWYYRITVNGGADYAKGSTKCRDLTKAMAITRQAFHQHRAAAQSGIKLTRETMTSLADKFVERQEKLLAVGVASHTMTRVYRSKTKIIKRLLGHLQPHEVTAEVWNEYVAERLQHGEAKNQKIGEMLGEKRRLARPTLAQERQTLRAILRLAVEKKLIHNLPETKLPKLGSAAKKKVSRPSFTPEQIKVLVADLQLRVATAPVEVVWNREMFLSYFMLSLYSGARPNDFKKLRWKDCSTTIREDGSIILVLAVNGKNIEHKIITQPEAFGWFQRLQRIARHTAPDDLVLTAASGKGPYNFVVPMRKLLERTNLRVDEFGRTRSIYSLRHVYAMDRLMQPGMNLKVLADNMGTSMLMLSRHYLSHTDVLSQINMLTGSRAEGSVHARITEAAVSLAGMVARAAGTPTATEP